MRKVFFSITMFFYNLFLPVGFLFFLPGMLWKLRNRPGWKSTYRERFGIIGGRREEFRAAAGSIWIHAVSVGETVLALALMRQWHEQRPEVRFVLSTGTTTGQALAREKAPESATVIFCPIDFRPAMRKFMKILRPEMICVFETELWPNMICLAAKLGIPLSLINARLSDHSMRGYRRIRFFMAPLLERFDHIFAQSEGDGERFLRIAPRAAVTVTGNLKFDAAIPENLAPAGLRRYFSDLAEPAIVLAASTHPGEEQLIASFWKSLTERHPSARLIVVPRHAERGEEIAGIFAEAGLEPLRRSLDPRGEKIPAMADTSSRVVIADTTGEMLSLMADSGIVIMGKAFAGQDEGHNLLEPALLGKPVITGPVLKNFRQILRILEEAGGVVTA